MKNFILRLDLRVALLYVLFGVIWIILSDRLLIALALDLPTSNQLQTYKGGAFVALSGVFIFLLLRHELARRRSAEGRLDDSDRLWHSVFAAAQDAILILNANYDCIAHNPAAEAMYGRGLTGLNLSDLRAPTTRAHLTTDMEQARRENGAFWESEHQRADGSFFSVEVSTRPFPVRDEHHFVHIVRDTTQRKRMEAALRESEERFRDVFESANVGKSITLLGGELSVNQAFADMLGYSRAELAHKTWQTLTPPDEVATINGILTQLLNGEREAARFTKHYLHKNGSYIWADVSVVIRRGKAGEPPYFITTIIDITERKKAEADLRLSRDRLAELSKRLVDAHETERRALGRELHDQFGQMLTALKITLDLAEQLPATLATQKLQQAQAVVSDLLSRVSRLSLELRPPMLDDLGLIPALIWHVSHYQEQTNIDVEFKHNGVEGQRFTSEVETTAYRIVQEALTNVARHAQAKHVWVEVQYKEGWLEIQIKDDGLGFEPEAALAKNRGLSGMRERAHLIGGTFQIESGLGQGTWQFIRLPWQERAE